MRDEHIAGLHVVTGWLLTVVGKGEKSALGRHGLS